MESGAPEPRGEEKAGVAPAGEGVQPFSSRGPDRVPGELRIPAIPDHELLRCIGRGAYGAVWLARNVMGTYRAVKIVHREDFARDRPFTREYEGLLHYEPISRSHPNLMQILHVGRHDSYFYYVTELADAAGQRGPMISDQSSVISDQGSVASYVPRTLQEDLERRGRLPAKECIALATALASALKHLHDCALVHRDVKPSNVIFVHGVPKLADIGLVATVGDSRSIVGTEGYLPPEGPGNPQADLYSLGKLLYEVSTGLNRGEYPRLPPNLAAMADAQELLEFNEVLLKACAKDTGRRYQQAEELLADLAMLERGDSVKRLRRLERHHALLKRGGVGVLTVGLLVSAAWWQTWRAHRIANRHLALRHVDKGTGLMAEGDYAAALPWLVGALQLEAGDSDLERARRTGIAGVLERCPMPVAHFAAAGSKVVTADFSPNGSVVATAHEDGCVRLWDTRSGRQLQRLPHDFPVSLAQFLPSGDRLLTLTVGQEAHIWNLTKPELAPLTFPQAHGGGGGMYGVGLNDSLALGEEPSGRVYLSKGRYCFVRREPYVGSFENLTLSLRLVGKGDVLLVKGEVRQTGLNGKTLFHTELSDSPAAEPFEGGSDDPPAPLWGSFFVLLENTSWANEPTDSGQWVWDNLRTRRYPTGSKMLPPWRVLDDFSTGSLTNWILGAFKEEGRSWRVENERLVLTCARLPRWQTASGWTGYRKPLQVSPTDTLEVAVDLISAQAPHRVANLTLARFSFTPFTVPDRPLIAHGRWLATTWWDAPLLIRDLEAEVMNGVPGHATNQSLELGLTGDVTDIDFSPDTNYIALVWRPNPLVAGTNFLRIWDFRSGSEISLDQTNDESVSSARFSRDSRLLAVTRRDRLELLRTTDWQTATNLATGAEFGSVRFSPRGHRLAALRDGLDIVVWDLGDLEAPPMIFPHRALIRRTAFSPDGRYLAAGIDDGTVQILDLVQGKAFGPPVPGALARFSPDGTQLLVIGTDSGAWLWDLSRIADDTLLVPPLRGQKLSASSSDRTMTAQITERGIALKTQAGQSLLVLPGQGTLRRIAFSADDQYLIAETADDRGWVWDLRIPTVAGPSRPVRYDASLTNHSLPHLSVEKRDRPTLSACAALLGQQRPDGTGGMIPVDETERVRILDELQRTRPLEFAVDDSKRQGWHREQAQAAELAMNWDTAVFHWERALDRKAASGRQTAEISMESRLAYAREAAAQVQQALLEGCSRWSVILRRPPWAEPGMLDLTAFYTRPLGEPLVKGQPSTAFRALGSGVQTLGGTRFDVRGIIDLTLTNDVEIPVGRVCKRLHFLHSANRAVVGRELAGSYQITFANGQTASMPLQNPEDLPIFTAHRFHEISAHSRTNTSGLRATLAWSGCIPGPARKKETLYLTRAIWDLPKQYRGEIVQTIKLRSSQAQSGPLIFAITVE